MSSMCAYNWHIFFINRFLHTAFFAHAYTETSYLSDEKYTMSTKLVVGQRFEPFGHINLKTTFTPKSYLLTNSYFILKSTFGENVNIWKTFIFYFDPETYEGGSFEKSEGSNGNRRYTNS